MDFTETDALQNGISPVQLPRLDKDINANQNQPKAIDAVAALP
jgi:hypothetical protein